MRILRLACQDLEIPHVATLRGTTCCALDAHLPATAAAGRGNSGAVARSTGTDTRFGNGFRGAASTQRRNRKESSAASMRRRSASTLAGSTATALGGGGMSLIWHLWVYVGEKQDGKTQYSRTQLASHAPTTTTYTSAQATHATATSGPPRRKPRHEPHVEGEAEAPPAAGDFEAAPCKIVGGGGVRSTGKILRPQRVLAIRQQRAVERVVRQRRAVVERAVVLVAFYSLRPLERKRQVETPSVRTRVWVW
ncbi:hypothetical protein B0H19DRAFT_1159285 [Mycena capillaripes]|nr:hypothetical protein B0H19DRAFT_1159285 [Mycena capillaripes]